MLLMLEDDSERIERFTSALRRIDPELSLHVWRDAWSMIAELESLLPKAMLISLDHDLEPLPGNQEDPGTGWDITKFMADLIPACPVIIHTSNVTRANWMAGQFDLGGWRYHRVSPIGDDWIETDWRQCVERLLKRS
jgi:hypothetical protein